jgi:hypothetical protein
MQGEFVTIIDSREIIFSLIEKFKIWIIGIENNNFTNFPTVDEFLFKMPNISKEFMDLFEENITAHLLSLINSYKTYFEKHDFKPSLWIRNPF